MNWYAILSEDLLSVIEVKQIESATVDSLRAANNPKALRIRDAVEGTKPTPSSSQVVIHTGWDIGEITATRTWGLRDKTAEELAEDARIATRDTLIAESIADFQLALTNWNTLTAAQQKAVLKRCVQVLVAVIKNELK